MTDKNSDYKKKHLNLNDFLPHVNKGDLLDSLNKNLFNRYLTKDEFDRIVGLIGDADPNNAVYKPVSERDSFRQNNQLQPVISQKIGSVNHYMGFEDFLTRIERTGVDTERFDEWGNVLQFNWVPPIDLDKIVNYRDYYWNSTSNPDHNIPQYITIKNKSNWARARYEQSLKTVIDVMPSSEVLNYVESTQTLQFTGNQEEKYPAGNHLVIFDNEGMFTLVTIATSEYKPSLGRTDITTTESFDMSHAPLSVFVAPLELPTLSVSGNSAVVEGDLSNLFIAQYVVGVNTSPATTLLEVTGSTFDATLNRTTITTEETIPVSVSEISVHPVVSLMRGEMERYSNKSLSFPAAPWTDDMIGTLIWADNTEVTTGTLGEVSTLGTNTLTDLSRDFTVYGITAEDRLHILPGNKNEGEYTINAPPSATQIVTNGGQFFTSTNIGYRVIRDFSLEKISQTPISPSTYDMWYMVGNDELRQFNGTSWQPKYRGISKLIKLIGDRAVSNYSNDNDWSNDNEWVHRSTIREFTGMIRAQMPIIEYFPFIELSETSYSSKVWRYRRTADVSYTTVDSTIEPKMIELMDFTYTGSEFTFVNPTTITFDQKYGNFVGELSPGDKIRLQGFVVNDGVYTIQSVDYSQPASGQRFVSTIVLETPLHDYTDLNVTLTGPRIIPAFTSMGDAFLGLDMKHWEFGGIDNIEASSIMPEPNPMLAIDVPALGGNDGEYEYFVGLNSQTYSSISGNKIDPILTFDPSLHDLVLYDDYQEGDIRVYINGVRIYGAFEDLVSQYDNDYVGGIRFINGFELPSTSVVRVELGEYAKSDIGKRAIIVNTPIGDELYNLTSIRKIEQKKSDSNQYPFFTLRDIYGERLTIASSIFKYTESETAPVNPNVLKRIVTDGTDYSFTQELKDHDTGRLYCYYDYERIGDELQTIWKHGTYSEQYVPIKIDGQWELPNQWYYNISHENYSEVKLTELFRHFKSIIDEQEQPGLFSKTAGLFWLDDSINYGLGGTIKEHNDGFDTLLSSSFVENGNPTSVIEFAKKQYDAQVEYLKERFYLNAHALFNDDSTATTVSELSQTIVASLINSIENNEKYDQWFGDSTSFRDGEGVRNWIASIPQFNLSPRFKPHMVFDSVMGIFQVSAHDGHTIDVGFDMGLKEQLLQRIAGTSIATYPPTGTPQDGDYSIENVTEVVGTKVKVVERKLYRYSATLAQWEVVDVNEIFAKTILEIENRLYNLLDEASDVGNFTPIYDVEEYSSTAMYNALMALQFEAYTREENIYNPLLNVDTFRQNDPFTWNYYHSTVTTDPRAGGTAAYPSVGAWQALYHVVYGTAYPHLEPWVLQGYSDKPSWWDSTYVSATGSRKWTNEMWSNIFDGTIPVGMETPDGGIGSGLPGQITELFDFVPVNIMDADTDDGYASDELLPPYWNTINTTNPRIRGLFDPNNGEFVTTPQLNFSFGQVGFVEWEWMNSTSYLYDKLVVAYKLDPMRFLHKTYGIDYQIVSCLQISKETEKVFAHNDVNFHGDFNDDTNSSYLYHGLNQWYVHYNRYSGYDGVASEFRSLWREWRTKLSYLVGAFLDTPSFSISNELFDITTKDYEIAVKKTKAIDDKWLTSLTGTVVTIPSQYSRLRDQGIGWTVEFTNNAPITTPIEYHPVQNYSVHYDSATSSFKTYSYPMKSASINPAKKYQVIEYNTPIALSFVTGLSAGTMYTLSVEIDDVNNPLSTIIVSTTIDGADAQTFGDLIESVNAGLAGTVTLHVENGNLSLYRNNNQTNSFINVIDDNIFSSSDGFVGPIMPAESTANTFTKTFRIIGNFQNTFSEVDSIEITNSTHFNGIYTIDRVLYDSTAMETVIFVNEDVTLPQYNDIVFDGYIEPENAKTLPPEWVDGTAIVFNTTGYTPAGIDDEIPYYVIRDDDRTFRISETSDGAKKRIALTNLGPSAQGELFAGKINSTFTALGGATSRYVWRIHEIDYRFVESVPRVTLSGIQQMVDFLVGYDAMTQTNGFRYNNPDGTNIDPETGRINNWQTITEKFITWLYALRNYQQESMLSYKVSANSITDTLEMVQGSVPNWANGTQVIIIPDANTVLPPEIDSPITSLIPYYVVRLVGDNSNAFRIAATSYDAERGNFIPFSDSGTGTFRVQMYKPISEYPTYELNPFKYNVWVNHEYGIMSNILDENFVDALYAPRMYDNNLIKLTTADVLVFREDTTSRISLTLDLIDRNIDFPNQARHIGGMHLFFDGYEHIISFEDYSVDDTLIYDSFLGLNTPRFYVEFDRQSNFTLRPNVGGFFLQDESLVQNFESLVNDMRYYYDSKTAPEGRVTTDLVRKSLGYDGPKDYMDVLNINNKTQFQFWQGMIQNKGTNKAITAFVNQDTFDTAEVDEFWTYKVAEFGDSGDKEYLEMKLLPDDVVKNDLRIEFIAPDNAPLDTTFTGVALTDMNRWWDQPDQLEAMGDTQTFFFNTKIDNILENMRDDIQFIHNKWIYVLDTFVDSVIIHYYDPITEKTVILNEDNEYTFLNSQIIEFLLDPRTLPPALTVSTISIDYDSQNPAKIIDKTAGTVITELPLWHPAIGYYNNSAYYPVDLRRPTDPAIYTTTMDGQSQGTSAWKSNREGLVWFDCSIEQYVPYWDKKIFPDINDRIEKWGQLAEWADINLYQWTRTTIHPDDFDELVNREEYDPSLSNDERLSGSTYRLLYENVHFDPEDLSIEPYWVKREDVHVDFIAGLMTEDVSMTLAETNAAIYFNGKYYENITFETLESVRSYFQLVPFNTFCHAVVKAPVPTREELQEGKYVYFTPHTVEKKFDPKSSETYNVYYYWVKDKKEPFSDVKPSVTLYTSKKQLMDMTDPFMLLQGIRTPDFGYGLIFGHVFDEFPYNLPYRYTQLVAKGLHGTVKGENRYVMRFTRDFTLRDKLDVNSISPKNLHIEWKLFREKQLEKIDRYLWNKLTEALIGYKLIDNTTIDYGAQIPSLDRVLYDRIQLADTRYGLGEDQVFTDSKLSLQTILGVLTDPNLEFEYVEIEDFLERHSFLTIEDIVGGMNDIYQNFSTREVNMIFFAVLHDAMSLKKEHKDIFKTSWVALQISQNVIQPEVIPYDELRLVPGPPCKAEPPAPSPSPSPTPSPTPSSTPITCVGEFDRATEDDESRLTEEDECREIEPPVVYPTPTPTQSSTPIPSPTPTPTPVVVDNIWNILVASSEGDVGDA